MDIFIKKVVDTVCITANIIATMSESLTRDRPVATKVFEPVPERKPRVARLTPDLVDLLGAMRPEDCLNFADVEVSRCAAAWLSKKDRGPVSQKQEDGSINVWRTK